MLIKEAKNILVVQLAGLGDMVLATPALSALRQNYPGSRIFLLTNSRAADIVRGSEDIDEIFICDTVRAFLNLLKRLRSLHFDLVINLYRIYSFSGMIKMLLLFTGIGGKYWAGRDTDGRGFFYTFKAADTLGGSRHEVERKLDIVRALGGKVDQIRFKIRYTQEEEIALENLFKKEGINKQNALIGINCTTVSPGRNWTRQGYQGLAERLVTEFPVEVVFCGNKLNYNIMGDFRADTALRVKDMTGKLTLMQLVVFIRRCKLLISPDSGPGHIAASLGTPLVSLFGEGEYEKLRPYGEEKKVRIIRTPLKLITVEQVFEQAKQLLKEYA
jgi:heptosyltransferase-1/heptosyltransferase-2